MDLIVGDVIEGVVSDFASDGEGVIKTDGYPVFVPYAIKGETVRARITYVKKDCAFGEVVDIVKKSPDRIKPYCPYFGKCGGCDLQHVSPSAQLEIKRDSVKNALKKFAGLDIDVPLPVRLNDWEYRNKLSLPFAYNGRSKRVSLGFYEKRSHKVVPMKWCPLHGQWASDLISAVTDWANEHRISVYDENTHKGLLRHAVARMQDTLSLTVVINGDKLPKAYELIQNLQKYFENFALYVSENTRANNVIMGDSVRLVYGKEQAQSMGRFKAVVSPKSFLQVNDKVRDAIYDHVAGELADFDGDIVELYSGVGLLTAQLALRLVNANITAVEIEKSAVGDALKLMRALGLQDRVKCICDDAKHYVTTLQKSESKQNTLGGQNALDDSIVSSPLYLGGMFEDKRRALVLDPPRRGCDREVLQCSTGFDKIVYISCNPQTLARDLKILSDNYSVVSVQPFDMFPQTSNIENVCVLVKK